MPRSVVRLAVLTGVAFVVSGLAFAADTPRHATAVERYGLEGYVQPIGLHHGFHIMRIAPGSAAEQDRLSAHDVIVKVDGEMIRSLEHLRTLLNDAYEDDGKVSLTILKNGSLEHHVLSGDVRGRDHSRNARGNRDRDEDDTKRR